MYTSREARRPVTDRCSGVSCPMGEVCGIGDGACHKDPCVGVMCKPLYRSCKVKLISKSAFPQAIE